MTWFVLAWLLALAAFPQSLARTRSALFALVERLAPEMKLSRLVFWVAVLAAVMSFGQVLAADLAWLAAVDAATYLEALAAVTIASGALRIGAVRQVAVAKVRRAVAAIGGVARRAARAVRTQFARKQAPPSDDRAPGLAWA